MRTTVVNHFHTFYPDAQAEYDRLALEDQRLARAMARRGSEEVTEVAPRRRMSEPPEDFKGERAKVQAQMEEQKAIISSGVVRVVLKALTRGEFRRLLSKHPAREDDDLDAKVGYNVDTFGEALIQACIMHTQDLDGNAVENEWARWADEMSNGQWDDFFKACLKLTKDGQPSLPR